MSYIFHLMPKLSEVVAHEIVINPKKCARLCDVLMFLSKL